MRSRIRQERGPGQAKNQVREHVLLTQHFAEVGIVKVRVLVREALPFRLRPHHEGVHGTPDPLFAVHAQRGLLVMQLVVVGVLGQVGGHDEESVAAGVQNSLREVHAACVGRME